MNAPIPINRDRRKADQRRISWLFLVICLLFAINCAVIFLPPLAMPRIFHALLVILLVAVAVLDRRGITRRQLLDLLGIATAIVGIGVVYALHTKRIVIMAPLFVFLLLATMAGIYFTGVRRPNYVERSES